MRDYERELKYLVYRPAEKLQLRIHWAFASEGLGRCSLREFASQSLVLKWTPKAASRPSPEQAVLRVHNRKMPDSFESPSLLVQKPDEVLFRIKGCHAFALELRDTFRNAGKAADIFYLEYYGNEDLAAHILVKTENGYFDSTFGPKTEETVKKERPKHEGSQIRVVSSDGWLTIESPQRAAKTSWLGLCVDTDFLVIVRARARVFIDNNLPEYGLA